MRSLRAYILCAILSHIPDEQHNHEPWLHLFSGRGKDSRSTLPGRGAVIDLSSHPIFHSAAVLHYLTATKHTDASA